MTRRHGQCRISSTAPAPCAPSKLSGDCLNCIRHAPWTPADPMARPKTVAIDGVVVTPKGSKCVMWVQA